MTPTLLALWRAMCPDLPTPEIEHLFHATRKWRFDYAWPAVRVSVELDGGQYVAHGGRHNRDSDRDKLNYAVAYGWRVLRFSNQQWERDPTACIDLIRQALQWRPVP